MPWVLLILWSSSLIASPSPASSPAPPQAAAQTAPPAPSSAINTPVVPPALVATDQQQFLAYWTAETGWSSEIHLRNNQSSVALAVTPVLRTPDGAETPLSQVMVQPEEVKTIDLNGAIMAARANQLLESWGSVVLRYRAVHYSTLYAAEMIHRTGHAIAIHIDGLGQYQALQAGGQEGIWWLPKGSTSDYLILSNQGENPLTLALSLYDAAGNARKQTITLGPRATNRYSVRQLLAAAGLAGGSYGGIKISANAYAGSLNSFHFLFDEAANFSAILKMFDYDPTTTLHERDYARTGAWTLRAPMLALSSPDAAMGFPAGTTLQPQLFIRNSTSKVVNASLRFNWRNDTTTGKAPGPALRLNPFETRRVDIAALQNGKILPPDARWTSITLTTDSDPDEVVAVAASYDATLAYGAQTPFSDQLTFRWKGGQWEVDALHDSIITAGNGGTSATRAAFTIFYNQGASKYELEETLQPDEQMWVDIGKLITGHVPDKNGNVLPDGLATGSYEVRDLTHKGAGTLYEGKVIYDKMYGHAAYGCASCCGNGFPYVYFNPLGIPMGSPTDQFIYAPDYCNNGLPGDVSDAFYGNWTVMDTSIATANYYGRHTGVSVGGTSSYTSGSLNNNVTYRGCPLRDYTRSGNDNVMPQITSISPALGLIGTTVYVTIIGSGFGSNPSVSAGTGIGVSINYVSPDGTEIQAYFQIFATATGGNQSITVTNNNQTSNSVNFFVQVPTSLTIASGDSTTAEAGCTTSGGSQGCGVTRSFIYQVNDQIGQPIQAAGLQVWDAIATTSPNNLNISAYSTTCTPANTGPCNVTTNSSGQFGENNPGLTVCSPVCRMNNACVKGGPTNANQTWHVGSYSIVQKLSYNCDKITVNGT